MTGRKNEQEPIEERTESRRIHACFLLCPQGGDGGGKGKKPALEEAEISFFREWVP